VALKDAGEGDFFDRRAHRLNCDKMLIALSYWRYLTTVSAAFTERSFHFQKLSFVFTFPRGLTDRVLTWFNFSKMMRPGLQGFRTWQLSCRFQK
jgi:hypothetical protein